MAKIAKFSMRRSLAGILNGCLLAALCIVVACGLSDTDNPKSLTGRGAGDKVPEAPVAGTTACPDTLFRSGDLVFRRGRSVSSDMVLLCEDKPTYSHVGLLVRTDSGWLVVHAAPDEADERGRYNRVTAETPYDYWQARRCRAAGVFRLPLSAAEAERLT
ncbi:MAG: hypothetical protein K2O01_06800, partial [Bacteroidales bacterium]|nr:hypothetical protein [Bacteroidales bacterium]